MKPLSSDTPAWPTAVATVDIDRREGKPCPVRRETILVVAPLLVLLILWIGIFFASGALKGGPSGKNYTGDFGNFFTGAAILRQGGNPYDQQLLFRSEMALLHGQKVPAPTFQAYMRVGNPPLFFWALQPLTRLAFQSAAVAWIVAMYLLSAVGFLCALQYFGWKGRFLPLVMFLLMPQVVTGIPNVNAAVFAAVACALLLSRRHPFAAGILLSLAWLKPQVGLPVVLLIAIFQGTPRGKVIAGFATATACLLALTVPAAGSQSLAHWAQGLVGYSKGMGAQPSAVSLVALYASWTTAQVRLLLEILAIGVACVLTAAWWWKVRRLDQVPILTVGWLWVVWMVVAPYGHLHDEILLTFPILALLGDDGRRVTRAASICVLYLLFFSLLLTPTSYLWAPLLVIAALLYYVARASLDRAGDQSCSRAG